MADRCAALGSDRGHLTDNGNVTLCGIIADNVGPDALRHAHRVARRCPTCYAHAPHITITPEPPRLPLHAIVPPRPPVVPPMRTGPHTPKSQRPHAPAVNIQHPDPPGHPLDPVWELCRRLDAASDAITRAGRYPR